MKRGKRREKSEKRGKKGKRGGRGAKRCINIRRNLKVHKIENFFDSDCGICVISLLVMSKY